VTGSVRVVELWRYPVKSLGGERLGAAEVTGSGLDGDREFAIFDDETGFGLTARRVPELLYASARHVDGGGVEIVLPDGSISAGDGALSEWLGRRVTLRRADDKSPRRYENPLDFEDEAASEWLPFDGSGGAFHDSARTAVSLVSIGTLGVWDRRRFRSNVVLEGAGEDALVGSQVRIGGAVLGVGKRISRCVMTTRPQPGGIDRDLDVLRTINRDHDGYLAVGALVVEPGTITTGDELVRI
jgi:uncharacterized protein YcbX